MAPKWVSASWSFIAEGLTWELYADTHPCAYSLIEVFKMNDPVEQSRKILVDDPETIQERPNYMRAVSEKLPKNGPKRKELEVCLSNAVQRSGLRRDHVVRPLLASTNMHGVYQAHFKQVGEKSLLSSIQMLTRRRLTSFSLSGSIILGLLFGTCCAPIVRDIPS